MVEYLRPLIVANWKMYGMSERRREVATQIALTDAGNGNVVVCPPFTAIQMMADALYGTSIKLGGQDCHDQEEGAFTGDVSAGMLKMIGCEYVLVGHSERRRYHKESNLFIKGKAEAAHAAGLVAIICVGEPLDVRTQGQAVDYVMRQVRECVPDDARFNNTLIAYEPVWSIGTGKTPTAAEIEEMHAYISRIMHQSHPEFGREPRVLYGGSVTESNAASLLKVPGVGGILVGQASLDARQFINIVDAANIIHEQRLRAIAENQKAEAKGQGSLL